MSQYFFNGQYVLTLDSQQSKPKDTAIGFPGRIRHISVA